MKIAIEAQRIFRKAKHGMDIVVLEIIRELQRMDTENEYYVLVAPGPDKCLQETSNVHIIEVKCPFYPLWEQIALPYALNKIKPDILHCTSNTAPMLCKIPLVLTLHDIIFMEKQQDKNKSLYQTMGRYYRRLVVPQILPHCKKIITVSDFERQHICEVTRIDKEHIVTVYNGYNKIFHPTADYKDITRKYIDKDTYLLFFGNTDPKKNTARTLKGYASYIAKSEKALPMLIVDIDESIVDVILEKESILHIKPYLHFPGYIKNTDLPYIYNGAFAFLYTSLRESFGLPIIESMACGTPVIVSNTSAIPEVAGDGALFINPLDEQDIAAKLLLLETDIQSYQQQVEYGKERAELFSWKKAANETLTIYKSTQWIYLNGKKR